MNERQEYKLKESGLNWMASSIAFAIILIMLSIFLFIFPEEMAVYKQGFQDGQANATERFPEGCISSKCREAYIEMTNYSNLTINLTTEYVPLIIYNSSNELIMKVYSNGTIFIAKNQEQQVGEEIARMAIAYSSYIDGWCDR